jgi:hypothetical protein
MARLEATCLEAPEEVLGLGSTAGAAGDLNRSSVLRLFWAVSCLGAVGEQRGRGSRGSKPGLGREKTRRV